MTAPIIFYDIPSNIPECKAWSPNTWKARFALNYKSITYKTKWVEYPDIENVYRRHNIPAAGSKEDGSPLYTLPVIHDPSTGKVISNSWNIVKYLEEQYPGTPTLFPKGTDMLQETFRFTFETQILAHLWHITTYRACDRLTERSQVYYRTTREASKGKKLEELAGAAEWASAEKGLNKLDSLYKVNGEGGDEWVMGSEGSPCFADIVVVSGLVWVMNSHGKDSAEWTKISSWNGGKWGRIVKQWEKYAAVDG